MITKEFFIDYSKYAEKFFSKHEDVRLSFIENIKKIVRDDINSVDVVRMKGNNFYYRMRIGKYRVIYMVINTEIVIIKVIKADSRGDVYKGI